LGEAITYANHNPSDYAERALFRAHFALIEGLFHQLREIALSRNETRLVLSSVEIGLLKEESYRLNDKGLPRASNSFEPFCPKLLFTMRCVAKTFGKEFNPDCSLNGWSQMKIAVGVRNRVTHPKSSADLSLTEDDLSALREASNWWQGEIQKLYVLCGLSSPFPEKG